MIEALQQGYARFFGIQAVPASFGDVFAALVCGACCALIALVIVRIKR